MSYRFKLVLPMSGIWLRRPGNVSPGAFGMMDDVVHIARSEVRGMQGFPHTNLGPAQESVRTGDWANTLPESAS